MIPPIIVCCQLSLEAIKAPRAVVQLQCRISQNIGNAILRELRANGANNHPLWSIPWTMNPPIITLSPV